MTLAVLPIDRAPRRTARWLRRLLPVLLLCTATAGAAPPMTPRDVPAPLQPWVGWVLHDQPDRFCTASADPARRPLCHWPAQLSLDLDAGGGRFALRAHLQTAGWLALPGDGTAWPLDVRADGRPAPVLDRQNTPTLWLEAGEHRIEGRLRWSALPESLRVPADTGLVGLRLDGREQAHPLRDTQNRLWLGRRAATEPVQAERLDVRVFRLLDDDIPARLTTEIRLDAGGAVREVELGPVLPEGLRAIRIGGDLPARLQADGRLVVQLRPGSWTLQVEAHGLAAPDRLAVPAAAGDWPKQEIWSFRAQPGLRVAELDGLPSVDPRQTGVPAAWQDLPAFLAEPGATLNLRQTRRGSADATPDRLHVQRELWLDFDGGGYTLRDHLSGELGQHWRLQTQAPIILGSVEIDGQAQPVTLHDGGVGVELRQSAVNLQAHARIDSADRRLPANGWNTDLQDVQATLHLPPAWRLIAAPGTDNLPDTWVSRWSLFDLFLVLVAAVAALRLFGYGAGALTLLTLALTWHEPGAPRWAWLNLIAALALLQVLPASFDGRGWPRRLLGAYRWLAVAILAFVALPFAVQQARLAVYPQLETPDYHGYAATARHAEPVFAEAAMPAPAPPVEALEMSRQALAGAADSAGGRTLSMPAPQTKAAAAKLDAPDPGQLTQTGPGLPDWHWRSTTLGWSGPVTTDQTFRLWLMPPWLTRTLGVLSILLIALLAARWLELGPASLRRLRPPAATAGLLLPLAAPFAALLLAAKPAPALAADVLPGPELLQQLQQRLIAPPACTPHCAHWSRLDLRVLPDERLLLRLTAEAVVDAALPLPVPALPPEANRAWQPSRVTVDGRDAAVRRDESGVLWIDLPAGVRDVQIGGSLQGFDQLQLPLLAPAPRQAQADAPGWRVSGIDALQRPGNALDLLRESPQAAESTGDATAVQALPPLLRLTRQFRLGLTWQLDSALQRDGQAQGALVLSLPALPGEVVTGDTVRRVGDRLELSFAPGQRVLRWTSSLAIVPRLSLQASERVDLFETWQFDASPVWHLRFEGLPSIGDVQGGRRMASFRPWPGEAVDAFVDRPQAVDGQVLTVDRADLDVQPGRRAADYTLDLRLRAGQGGPHTLPLPPDLSVRGLQIDGRSEPPRRDADGLRLALRPGTQQVRVELRRDEGLQTVLRTPPLDLAAAGANARLHVQVPAERWVLLAGGPALGPAILFWGLLLVLLAVAVALGRSGLTPLRGWQWALLGIGLSQLSLLGAAVVAGWLFALALHGRQTAPLAPRLHNTVQIALAIWTVVALGTLFGAVAQGLLGTPDMQIAGNDSTRYDLYWYQDRFATALPEAWVLSVSIWFYRGLMLLWALWLANSLLNWLRWGWTQYAQHGLWKKTPRIDRPDMPSPGDATP